MGNCSFQFDLESTRTPKNKTAIYSELECYCHCHLRHTSTTFVGFSTDTSTSTLVVGQTVNRDGRM